MLERVISNGCNRASGMTNDGNDRLLAAFDFGRQIAFVKFVGTDARWFHNGTGAMGASVAHQARPAGFFARTLYPSNATKSQMAIAGLDSASAKRERRAFKSHWSTGS
jgi:hypothetical protein